MLSHELRTPLAAIIGFADVRHEQVDGEQSELVGYIRENGHRLQRVLTSILELQEADTPGREHETMLDVVDRVRDATERLRDRAESRDVTVSMTSDADRVHSRTIPSRLDSALDHILDNACKFTESGSIQIHVAAGEDAIRIDVLDTGIGLSGDTASLLEPFRQGSTGLARTHDGLGLGLHLADRALRSIGGSLELAARPEGGTRATLTVPVRREHSLRRAA